MTSWEAFSYGSKPYSVSELVLHHLYDYSDLSIHEVLSFPNILPMYVCMYVCMYVGSHLLLKVLLFIFLGYENNADVGE